MTSKLNNARNSSSLLMISYLWAGNGKMGKHGVFIPSHSHQAVLISIPMKLTLRFPFPWEFHGTNGNFQYKLISKRNA